MKIHQALAVACRQLLQAVFEHHAVADRSLQTEFQRNPKWGKRDRSFVASTVYDLIRWRRRYEFLAESDDLSAMLGAYWTLKGSLRTEQAFWPDVPLALLQAREVQLPEQPRAIRESSPDWLDAYGAEQLGARWDAELSALNVPAPIFLRVNSLRATRERAIDRLAREGVSVSEVPGLPMALKVEGGQFPPRLLQDGWFELQDGGSQLIAPFLQAEPGQRVIDACAGAGGKTLHLAALMEGKGQIRTFDVAPHKAEALRKRAERAGALPMITTQKISPELLKRNKGWAQRLLLDVPCSGSGTLRRQPDLKWKITPHTLAQTVGLQRDILEHYGHMLEPGGLLVYATCSIFPVENERQVDWFLQQNQNFTLEEMRVCSPAETGFDGFFMARLRRLQE